MKNQYDVVVIGGGPGGYTAAIRAAQLGLRTALVEKREVGGTCLNRGCIPTKAMLHAACLFRQIKSCEQFGISVSNVAVDYKRLLAYMWNTTSQLRQGVEQLLRANAVVCFCGKGRLLPDKKVQINGTNGETLLCASYVILATGSMPRKLPIPGMDLPGVLTSDEIFELEECPSSLIIIGGGAIGVEFAEIFSSLGSQVTLLEAQSQLLPGMDKKISRNLQLVLKKRGVDIHTSVNLLGIEPAGTLLTCSFQEDGAEAKISAQNVLFSVGRCPNIDGLLGEGVEIEITQNYIAVDETFQTSMEDVYAIGDLISGAKFAHAASTQGIVTAEYLADEDPSIDVHIVPKCVYTDPEILAVGLTEDEAKARGIPVRVGEFIMSANGKSLIQKAERGFIQIVSSLETGEILGAQLMCSRASDMAGELVTALENHLTVSQFHKSMRAHPTYNEGISEALAEFESGAIHSMPKGRLFE